MFQDLDIGSEAKASVPSEKDTQWSREEVPVVPVSLPNTTIEPPSTTSGRESTAFGVRPLSFPQPVPAEAHFSLLQITVMGFMCFILGCTLRLLLIDPFNVREGGPLSGGRQDL